MTWFHTFDVDATGVLAETEIKCDGAAPADSSNTTSDAGLTNGNSYEVQVVGINDTSGVIDAPSFHVVPRTTPNKPTLTGKVGKDVTGADYTMTGNAYNNATSQGKCIEVSLSAAAAADSASPDIAYILQVGSLYKYYTSAPDDLIITDGETGWYASEATMKQPLDSYVLSVVNNGLTTDLDPAAGSQTLSLVNGTPYEVKAYTYNKWGLGASSFPAISLTPSTRPDAPQGSGKVGAVDATGAGTGDGPGTQKIAVTITAEDDGGAPLGGQEDDGHKYTFTLVDGNSVTTTQVFPDALADDDARVYELINLTNGTSYAVSVVAENANAQSASLDLGSFIPRDQPGVPDLANFTAAPHLDDQSPSDWADDVYAKGINNGTFIDAMGADNITYQYQLSTSSDFTDIKDDVSGVGLTAPEFKDLGDLGLANGANYYLRVFGVNEHNEKGEATTYTTGATPQPIRPSKPPSVDASGFAPTVGITQSHSVLKIDLKKALTDVGGVDEDLGGYSDNTVYRITVTNAEDTTSNNAFSHSVERTYAEITADTDNVFVFGVLDTTTSSQGLETYHRFTMKVEAKNAIYDTYMAPDAATIASGSFYVTNQLRTITIAPTNPTISGAGDAIRGEFDGSVSIPHGYQYPPLANDLSYVLQGDEWTQATADAAIAKTGSFSDMSSTAGTKSAPATTQRIEGGDTADATLDLGSVGSSLLLGSDYRLKLSPVSKDTYSGDTIAMSDIYSGMHRLTAKPFLEVAGNVVTISSNGSALDDSFILSTQGSAWAIQNIKAGAAAGAAGQQGTLQLSTTGLYGDNNPPFTQYKYITSSGSAVGSLKSTVTPTNFNSSVNYLALTENANGATIKLNGSIVNQ